MCVILISKIAAQEELTKLIFQHQVLAHMRGRMRREVEYARGRVEGNWDKTDNPISEEMENVEVLVQEMKRVGMLKQTREGLKRALGVNAHSQKSRL